MTELRTRCFFAQALVFILAILACSACRSRSGDQVLIPEGYEGWVVVSYAVPGQPELRLENGKNVLTISPSGKARTRSTRDSGWASDEYFFVGPTGSKTNIPVNGNGCDKEACISEFRFYGFPQQVTVFFVGRTTNLPRYQEPSPPNFDGQILERRLEHESGEALAFYRSLQGPVRVGIEATGPIHLFERMLVELGHIKTRIRENRRDAAPSATS